MQFSVVVAVFACSFFSAAFAQSGSGYENVIGPICTTVDVYKFPLLWNPITLPAFDTDAYLTITVSGNTNYTVAYLTISPTSRAGPYTSSVNGAVGQLNFTVTPNQYYLVLTDLKTNATNVQVCYTIQPGASMPMCPNGRYDIAPLVGRNFWICKVQTGENPQSVTFSAPDTGYYVNQNTWIPGVPDFTVNAGETASPTSLASGVNTFYLSSATFVGRLVSTVYNITY